MIHLRKRDKPSVLVENESAWTAELLRALDSGDTERASKIKFRYRHPEIKAIIVAETLEKCAYCESAIRHVMPGDTEHIAPSSKFPELTFEWTNLTLVCVECNRNKLDYHGDDERTSLVNPYVAEPRDHLRFFGPMVMHMNLDRGYLTIRKLKLYRRELEDRRRERIQAVHRLLDLWRQTEKDDVKQQLAADIREEAGDDREYAAAVRDYLRAQHDFDYEPRCLSA